MTALMETDVVVVGGAATIVMVGEIDVAVVPKVRNAFDDALKSPMHSLLVDLSAVTFCDSSGLSEFARAEQECLERDVEFHVAGATQQVRLVFEVTGLGYLLDSCEIRSLEPDRR